MKAIARARVIHLGVVLAATISLLLAIPSSASAETSTRCFDVYGGAGGTGVRALNYVEFDDPEVTVCVASDAAMEEGPRDVKTFEDCGTPCYRLEMNFYLSGTAIVSVEHESEGRAKTYSFDPVEVDKTLTLCMTGGVPKPPCSYETGTGAEPAPEPSAEPTGGDSSSEAAAEPSSERWVSIEGVRSRRRVELTGHLNGPCTTEQQVVIKMRRIGERRFRNVAAVFTDTSGNYAFSIRAARGTSFRAVALSSGECLRVVSSSLDV